MSTQQAAGDRAYLRNVGAPTPAAQRAEPGRWEALPLLRAVARRRVPDSAEAEDAVQDALLTLHTLCHTYDPARPIRPWLVAICERRCVDRMRRRLRRSRHETPIDELAEAAAPAVEGGALRAVAVAELRTAVAALPRAQRVALQLAKLKDLSLAEASVLSGLSVCALKMATHRAVGTLRGRLRVPAEA